MNIVICCSIIALLLAYLESIGKLKHGMVVGFIIMTILEAIRYNYGNDYMSYYADFISYTNSSFNFQDIISDYKEPGWVLLCWVFKPIGGFFMMMAAFAVIQNSIVYRSIKRYVEKQWWLLSFAIYILTVNYYLLSFSMIRQSFVVFLFIGLWPYIERKKWWIALLVLLLCSFVHSSAIILLPFAFWGFLPVNKGRIVGLVYAIILLFLWFSQDKVNSIFQYALSLNDTLDEYATTYGERDIDVGFGVGFIINMIPFVLSITFLISKSNHITIAQKRMVALAAVSYLILPFGQIIHLVARLGIYFGVFTILTIPHIYGSIKNVFIRNGLLVLFVLIMVYSYISFFNSEIYGERYATFHSIFSVL